MSSVPQQIRRSGFTPDAFGALKDRVINKEDHGPKYVYSPGEPMHRVDKRDGVPHIYPGLVRGFESYINWHTSYTKPEVGAAFTAEQANDMVDKMRYGAPIYAGGIRDDIVLSPSGSEKCTVNLDAFENLAFEDTRWEEFNAMIMPEPVFYSAEEVPLHLLPAWRAQSREIGDKCRELGGLNVREEYLKAALRQFQSDDSPICRVYARAVQQMLSACEAFRRFGESYLDASDLDIDNHAQTGKNIYDNRDLRLEWLLAHKSKRDRQSAPVIQFQAPAAVTDAVERKACPECGEMIAVVAKVCIHCKTRFVFTSEPDEDLREPGMYTETDTAMGVQRRRKTLEEKQAETRERNGK